MMELWIRSQDKETLLKINNLEIKEFKEGYGIGQWLNESNFYGLGIYKTKERALEVLDEIQKLIDPVLVFKNCECDNDTLKAIKEIGACMVNDNSHIEQIQSCVYEMPED